VGPRQGATQPPQARAELRGGHDGVRDDRSLTTPDPAHSVAEERFLLLGRTSSGRIVVVAFTERSGDIDTIRLISARLADRGERHDYEEGQA